MVVFNCNACSATLKRNQVEKHCYQCRGCESLSCIDCGKDFWGNDYQQHIKCITEEEKYTGKTNNGSGPKVFKGDAKQEQWTEQVLDAIQKVSNPKLKWLLEKIADYPNIPRKKAKFQNFIKNSLRVNGDNLISEVWDVLMASRTALQTGGGNESKDNGKAADPDLVSVSNGHTAEVKIKLENAEEEEESSKHKTGKSKREKKEERKQKAHKKEKKDKVLESVPDDTSDAKATKKRKREELEEQEEKDTEEEVSAKKKKKKKKDVSEEVTESIEVCDEGDMAVSSEEDVQPVKRKKTKFNWEEVIVSVLKKKGEMSLKKLKKKVLCEFASQDAANYSEDNLSAKFDKKILKTDGVKVSKDRASLKTK